MTNKTNINFGPPYLKWQLNTNTLDSPCLDADVGSQSHETSIEMQRPPLFDSLFRLVRDGSVLRGPFVARHRGVRGSNWKADGSLCFWIALAVL